MIEFLPFDCYIKKCNLLLSQTGAVCVGILGFPGGHLFVVCCGGWVGLFKHAYTYTQPQCCSKIITAQQ